MVVAPKFPPSRDQVVDAIETMGRHLDARIDGVKADLSEVKADLSEVKADLSEVKADLSEVKADLSEVKADLSELKVGLATLASVTQDNQTELNRKLDRLLSRG